MEFNETTFEVLRYGRDNNIKENTNYQTTKGTIMEKDNLGVIVSNEATFKHHISSICKSATRLSGWILRTFKTREQKCMITLWKSLEYCCHLWNPDAIGDIQELEALESSFTSRISSPQGMNYWQRLQHLGLYSLQHTRERYQIIYVWKILEGLVPNVGIELSQNRTRGRTCYVKGVKSNCLNIRSLIRATSLSRNEPRIFNSLPPNLKNVSSCSVEVFKHRLDAFLQRILSLTAKHITYVQNNT